MALTAFEKTTLTRMHDEIFDKRRAKKATAQDLTDLDTILTGTEAERQTLLTNYVNNVGIPQCDAGIADCDATKTEIQTLKTDMEAYVA